MIYFTGDLHGEWDISKLNNDKTKFIKKDDFVIVSGDFGLVWNYKSEKECKHWRNWLDEKLFITLFVPGNHENYERLLSDEFPEVEMFGGIVKQISKKIFMLQTGHIYTIQGKKIFAFGGAESVDKLSRKIGISWWHQEIPSTTEFFSGLKRLEENENEVDIVITHATHLDCFNKALHLMPSIGEKESDPVSVMLQEIKNVIKYKLWVCGHYHLNCFDAESKTAILYNLVISLDELQMKVDKGDDSFVLMKL